LAITQSGRGRCHQGESAGSYPARASRGGVRVIYMNRLTEQKIWLLFMYSKAVQADVERKLLKKLRETIDG